MRPEDFFKSAEDCAESRKQMSLMRYMEKIIKKYFRDCISPAHMREALYDRGIEDGLRQFAVRDVAEGMLKRTYFTNEKTDVYQLLKQGLRHEAVRTLLEAVAEHDCDVLVFPVYKAGNWVAHILGESAESLKVPRIVIPGDGLSVKIQTMETFYKEYM